MSDHSSVVRPSLFENLSVCVGGFSTRHGGVSAPPYASLNLGLHVGDEAEHVEENRRRFCRALGLGPEQLVTAGQVHGNAVRTATEPGHVPFCDGLVTDRPGLLLAIATADCAALLLVDPEAGVVGACHAGWRGTVANVSTRTVEAMRALGAAPDRLYAYVSPCISVEAFEVGSEVAAQFDDAFVHHFPDEPKPHVDLKAALKAQLRAAGVPDAHIEVSPHCTARETEDFYSHRAENGTTGRMLGAIALQNDR